MRIRKRNNVQIYGNGTTPIMFAHGFGCDQQVWEYVIPEFFDTYQVILFDYVGSGRASVDAYSRDRYGFLDGYAQDVIEILDELNISDCIFVGHSVSGMIGLEVALKRPDLLSSTIMISSSPHFLNDGSYQGGYEEKDIQELLCMIDRDYREWTNYMAPISMKNINDPKLTEELEEMYADQNPEVIRQFAEVTFFLDMRDKLEKNTIPSLLLQTKEDNFVTKEAEIYLHEHLPYSEYVELDAEGHNPHISNPDEVTEQIMGYLQAKLWKSS
ncbi:alpha/beta fold hydrolase [Salimicrobium halophilum]|uniref:Pimeloyl-ACP methyl ester carboxylesterase n=1 Tax=Salimicrobium halophilum TaxID=86666 RepID=A0A1G8UR10_9BACI|nr:alpha/beta hydrolase [Salimicrobium halophilum]SDJ55535.1 Pimeloyl-ACP methyl ester carboxylesterase [Salimicrobium halophilum]